MPAQCPKTKQNQITKGTITLGKEGSEIKAERKKKEKPIIDPVLSCLAAHQGPILSGPAIASSSIFFYGHWLQFPPLPNVKVHRPVNLVGRGESDRIRNDPIRYDQYTYCQYWRAPGVSTTHARASSN